MTRYEKSNKCHLDDKRHLDDKYHLEVGKLENGKQDDKCRSLWGKSGGVALQ